MANCLLKLAFLNLVQAVYRVYRLEFTDIPSHSCTGRHAKSINFGRGQNFHKFSSDSARDVITTCIRNKANSIHVSFKLLPIETLLKIFYARESKSALSERDDGVIGPIPTWRWGKFAEIFLKNPEFHWFCLNFYQILNNGACFQAHFTILSLKFSFFILFAEIINYNNL